jgi:hypothetical protein
MDDQGERWGGPRGLSRTVYVQRNIGSNLADVAIREKMVWRIYCIE